MTFLTVTLLSIVLLAIPLTRVYGAIGVALLLYVYPLLTLGAALVAGGAYYYYRRSL